MHSRKFREDLYYRLNVFPIQIPPRRERPDDVLALAHFFLFQFTRQFHKDFREIDQQAAAHLKRYAWPGNVRELRNVLERQHGPGLTAAGNSAGHAALQDEKVQNRRVTDSRGGYEGVGPAVCRPLD
ncbi:MAG: hypothetical protein R6X05_07540 [Desulfobacterales bacterium]